MNKILIILSFVLLASCGVSQEEKKNIAAVTCSIMGETRNMDSAVRVREMNNAREKIGGEAFLDGDDAIQEAFEWGLCQELVLGTYDEKLQSLKDAKQERERIADSKPTVKEEFHSNGKLESRINYQSKNDGGKKHGLTQNYRSNGQLAYEWNYKDGRLEVTDYKDLDYREGLLYEINSQTLFTGIAVYYYENGQLERKENFKDGFATGPTEFYHENGQLNLKRDYKDGKPEGLWESYRENGLLRWKGNHKDGKAEGLSEGYDENGQVRFKYCYNNGEITDMSYCEK